MYDKYAWSLLCPWAFFYKPGLNNWLPEILLSYGFSATAAGYWASVPSAIGIIGVLFIPRFASPERRNWVMGALFIAVLAASLLLQNSHPVFLGIGLTLQGLARGSMMTVAIMILMETPGVPEKKPWSGRRYVFYSSRDWGCSWARDSWGACLFDRRVQCAAANDSLCLYRHLCCACCSEPGQYTGVVFRYV